MQLFSYNAPHGGDSYGSEFSTIGYEIALSLSELNQSIVDDEKFMKAIESVVVYSDESYSKDSSRFS